MRSPQWTTTDWLGRDDDRRRPSVLRRARDFLPGTPNIRLPRPFSISGRSVTGNASMRPSLFTDATSAPASPPAPATAGRTFAFSGRRKTVLPARFRPVSDSSSRDEAVAGVAGEQPSVRGSPISDGGKGRAFRRIEPAGQRLALAARRRQRVGRQRIGAAGRVDEHRLLRAAALRRGLECVAGLVGELLRVDVVAARLAHPAERREHDRDRLRGDEFRLLRDRLRRRALDDLRAARVAILRRVRLEFVADQLAAASPRS